MELVIVLGALGCAVTACGSEDLFTPKLASNERLIEREAVARLGPDDQLLQQFVVVGDLDGDGADDAVVSTSYLVFVDAVLGTVGERHAVYLLYGGNAFTGEIDVSTLPSLAVSEVYGPEITLLGDVDGDGLADFLVHVSGGASCAPGISSSEDKICGGTYLVYGSRSRLTGVTPVADVGALLCEAPSYDLASNAAGLGDLDGDGKADFAIGRPASATSSNSSQVFLFYGRSERLSGTLDPASTADAVISEPTAFPRRVPELMRAGDVDGDGYGDFILKLPSGPSDPDLRLVHGAATRLAGTVAIGASARSRFVYSDPCLREHDLGGPLGDLDGDGFDDFALASCLSFPAGSPAGLSTVQRVFYGRRGGFPAQLGLDEDDATLHLTEGNAGIVAGGDVDGDGICDLIVGDAGLHDGNGGVHVIQGNGVRLSGDIDLGRLGTIYIGRSQRWPYCDPHDVSPDCIVHETVGAGLGVGDLTGDHRMDILVSAPTDHSQVPLRGVDSPSMAHAYLVSPSTGAKP